MTFTRDAAEISGCPLAKAKQLTTSRVQGLFTQALTLREYSVVFFA
jgi:hypothetical protein